MKQREIKFRAWLKEHRLMVTQKDFNDYPMVSNGDGFGIVDSDGGWMSEDSFIIMQYTGLKDKDGVEIYEGDVLHSEHWNPSDYKVVFEKGEFCFVSLEEVERPYTNSIHYLEDFKIVGNIYE